MKLTNSDQLNSAPTPSQYLFALWKDICGSTVVCSGVSIKTQASFTEQLFKQAYKKFISQSPELRLAVAQPYEAYGQLQFEAYQPASDSAFAYEESSSVEAQSIVADLLNMELGLTGEDNHLLRVTKCSPNEYLIFLAVEHLFADGLGVDALLSRYLKTLDGLCSKASAQPLRPRALTDLLDYFSYEETVAPFVKNYIKQTTTSSFLWNPDAATIADRKGRFSVKTLVIAPALFSQLNATANASASSLFSLLLASFAKSFFQFQPTIDDVSLQIPTHGRQYNGKVLDKSLIGCFAQAFLIVLKRQQLTEFSEGQVYQYIHDYAANCMEHDVDQITARRNATSIFRSDLKQQLKSDDFAKSLRGRMPSNIYFSLYGGLSLPSKCSIFEVVDYYLATTNMPGSLDITVGYHNGSLKVSFNYDSLFFSTATIDALSKVYLEQLVAIADTPLLGLGQQPKTEIDQQRVAPVIGLINKFSLQPVDWSDIDAHLEIDLGLDSLSKTHILVDALKVLQLKSQDVDRHAYYSSGTLRELLQVFPSSIQVASDDTIA
ncbi:hypothetical protein ALP45_01549 [Pseudomonas coronafaciens pv. atropurpurea]|uniref:hypothetical protein n=1 Tax=Pseudomonas coronafaciens TaxID=53409 RepID=UPI0006D6137A|nr:hypothetical protein [Pseudomonas coronafaciens]KPW37163.1 Uncharacterized protein ALO66_00310 [Pseudomonas coronafaciens pv. atropurpurea]RMT62418.1 hypothetical protein ALP45_01549 [Pseudomonas coronafaciens pv. atropurpurea]